MQIVTVVAVIPIRFSEGPKTIEDSRLGPATALFDVGEVLAEPVRTGVFDVVEVPARSVGFAPTVVLGLACGRLLLWTPPPEQEARKIVATTTVKEVPNLEPTG